MTTSRFPARVRSPRLLRWGGAALLTVGVVAGLTAPPPPPAEAAIVVPIDLMRRDGLQLVAMNDPRWADLLITPTQTKFGGCGCWLASIATIFSFQTGFPAGSLPRFPMALDLTRTSGLDFSFSPPYFDAFASENGGYESITEPGKCGTSIKPDAFEDAANPVADPVTGKPLTPTGLTWTTVNGFGADVRARVDHYLTRGWPVAVRTERDVELDDGTFKSVSHMQMIVGYEPRPDGTGEYLVLDPSAYGATGPEAESFVYEGFDEDGAWASTVKDVRFVEPVYANSTWFGIFDDPEPIELVITDPLGRRMGVDPRTGANFNEQPTGSYERTNGWADPLGAAPPADDQKRYWTRNPLDGVYTVEVIGTGTGDWTLDVWNGGPTFRQTLTGSTTAGEVDRYTVRLEAGRIVQVTQVPFFRAEAEAGANQTTIPGVAIRVDGYRSWAPSTAPIASYSWDFGDGTPAATGRAATHTYAAPGNYRTTLTVTDTDGRDAVDILTVSVIQPPPPGRVTSMLTESRAIPGVSLNGGDFSEARPAITPDGRFVAYTTRHVLTLPAPGTFALYRQDTTTGGVVQLIPHDPGLRHVEDITADGRWISFVTTTAHVAADTNGVQDVYLVDATTGAFELAALADDESTLGSTNGGSMSADGRFVMFGAASSAIWFNGIFQEFGRPDVFVRDRQLGTTRLVSTGPTGEESQHASYVGAVSDDGNVVAFSTFSSTVAGGFGGFFYPVMVTRDLRDNSQQVVDIAGNSFNVYPVDISGDGRYVAFLSNGQLAFEPDQRTTLVIPEPFLYDRVTQTLTHIAPPVDGVRQRVAGFTSGGFGIDMSDNGQWVAFTHRAPNIVPGDTNDQTDVFLYEVATGTVSRESVTTANTQSTGAIVSPTGSPSVDNLAVDDSGGVVFESSARDLTPEMRNVSAWNLYRRGLAAGGANGAPVAELGGPYVGFASTADAPAGVRLDGTRSVDPEAEVLTGEIDPGDGSAPLTGLSSTNSYTTAGSYTATIQVTDGERTGTDPATVDVLPAPLPDTVYAPACASPGATVDVGGIARAANASILTSGWDTSQGPAPLAEAQLDLSWGGSVSATSTLPDLSFVTSATVPDTPGTYAVSLAGTAATASITVPCATPLPIPKADAGGPYEVVAGQLLQLDGSASVGAQSFGWVLGDGNAATGPTPTHTYTAPGTYVVQLVVGDSDGTQVDAARQGLIAVAGVFGRTSDTSVFAPSSRAVVQVLPAQVPPTDPPETTAPTTAPATTAAPSTTVAPVTTATPTTLAPTATSTTAPAASPATPPPTTAPIRRLPSTGGESGLQMRLAIGLTGTGALLVALSRRRGRAV